MDGIKMMEMLKEVIALTELQKELGRRTLALDKLYAEEQISDEQYLKALLTAKKDTEEGMARLDVLKKDVESL